MSDENQPDPIILNISIPSIVVNRHDNRSTGMHIDNVDNVIHNHAVEQPIGPQGLRDGERPLKPTIQDIFGPDNIDQLLQEEKYYEAYVASLRHREFDTAVFEFKDLINHYRCCMLVGEAEKAVRTRDQLTTIIERNIQTTPYEIKMLADESRREGKVMEAILFYRAAADLYGKQLRASLVGRIAQCVFGIKESIVAFLSRDVNQKLKPIVQNQVIPQMRDIMRVMIQRADNVSEEDKCWGEVWCLVYIDACEELVDDWDNREETLKYVISILAKVYMESAVKHSVYGTCLYNLGFIHLRTSRPNDASEFFRRAIAAFQQAEDIKDEKKKECIERCEEDLNEATKRQSTSRN